MKKIILSCLLLISMTALSFAEEVKTKMFCNVDVGTGTFIEFDSKNKTTLLINPVLLSLQMTRTFNKFSAYKFAVDAIFPYNFLLISKGSTENVSKLVDSSIGMQFFVGGSFCIINKDNHFMDFGGGFHFFMLSLKTGSQSVYNLGFGCCFSLDYKLQLNNLLFLNFGGKVSYDGFSVARTTYLSFNTNVGVGLKF